MNSPEIRKINASFPPVRNYDGFGLPPSALVEKQRHGRLFPNNIRGLLVGASGAGKTNYLIHMLLQENGIRFQTIILISSSHEQEKYCMLRHVLTSVPEINFAEIRNIEEFREYVEVKCGGALKPNTLLIFDDLSVGYDNEFLPIMQKYFTTGRHGHIDVFLLYQSYAFIPKSAIRDQLNLIFIFRQDGRNLQLIFRDHCYHELPYSKFLTLCQDAWNHKDFGCLIIDKSRPLRDGKFRRSLNEVYKNI